MWYHLQCREQRKMFLESKKCQQSSNFNQYEMYIHHLLSQDFGYSFQWFEFSHPDGMWKILINYGNNYAHVHVV